MVYLRRIAAVVLCALPLIALAQADVLNKRIAGRLEQVTQMLKAASVGNADGVADAKTEIEELPYPTRGDRRAARKLNTNGLEKFKAEHISASLTDFERAWSTDPSDQEITNNYGYVLYRSGRLAEAEKLLRYTLALAPARSTAWANLAEVFGAQGDASQTSAAFVVAHRFSRNPETTRQYIENFAANSDVQGLKAGAQGALAKLFSQQNANSVTAVATTATEKKAMQATEFAGGAAQSARSATTNQAQGMKVPEALTNPMRPFVLKLADPESVVTLHQQATRGDAAARDSLLRLALAGNARAQNAVGNLYSDGSGVQTNHELANIWYGKSAKSDFPLAQFALAWNLDHGIGGGIDKRSALENYKRAAEQGHPVAMNNLAVSYFRGQGVPIDTKVAFNWFLRGAEAGYARSAHNAGLMLKRGEGVAVNLPMAFAYQMSAANVGLPQAELEVAQAYDYGWGVSADKNLAIVWYKKASHQGIEFAQLQLKRLGVADF
ncbi:MAG: hypothetical protein V4573_08120 [Pseudomonadota bacterium]